MAGSIFRRQLEHVLPTVMQHSNPAAMSSPAYAVTTKNLKDSCDLYHEHHHIDRLWRTFLQEVSSIGHPLLVRGFDEHGGSGLKNKSCFPR